MKKYMLLLLSCFFWNQSFALSPLECYTQSASETFSSTQAIIETPSQDLIAVQDGLELPLSSAEYSQRYLPFTANIPSRKDSTSLYAQRYLFETLDSQITSEIILDTSDIVANTPYELIFLSQARSHKAVFYISQDGQSYSQVQQADISDFSPKKIKIVWESTKETQLREKIEISELSIRKRDFSNLLSGMKSGIPVYFYMGNTCKTSQKMSQWSAPVWDMSVTSLYFVENPRYYEYITDSDSDGIKDHKDNCKNLANRDQKDINQNKVWDACEFDTDSDGVPDEVDNCRNTVNPEQKDSDGDGIGDVCDNCDLYNPDQFDTDGNKTGDRCDQAQKYLLENDTDSDGVENARDICPKIANPLQEDDDADGVGNVCDNCKSYQNPFQEDINTNGVWDICEDGDADGLEWLQDNCPTIANPEQADDDNDGVGNICEDDDGDGVLFSVDNCPYVYNPDQSNIDSDVLGDVCDESDDRFLESNKTIFIILMILAILGFIAGIYVMAQKIQK